MPTEIYSQSGWYKISVRSEIRGKVTGAQGVVVPGAPVFLEPLDLKSGAGLITMRKTRTDLQGSYRFTALPPGRYRVLSSFDLDRPTSEEMEAAHAMSVTLEERNETAQDLELVEVQ